MWWISSIIDLQPRLVIYIDNLKVQGNIGEAAAASDTQHKHSSRLATLRESSNEVRISEDESIGTTETDIHNEVIENYDILLNQSKQDRKAIVRLTRQTSRVIKKNVMTLTTFGTQTQWIHSCELQRRKTAAEGPSCPWLEDLIGRHRTIDCCRAIRKRIGTAHMPQQMSHPHP